MFDINVWLSEVKVDEIDESLSKLETQLFVLSDSLLNENSGPLLAAVIVSAEDEHGIPALVDLADEAEPRMVLVALSNLLYAIQRGHGQEFEYQISGGEDEGLDEVSINAEDLPSVGLVKMKISSQLGKLVERFHSMIDDGEFCCDTLTYLLTLLITCSVEQSTHSEIRKVASIWFLKTIMRCWLRPEFYTHQTLMEGGTRYTLGFMITCYLKSLIRLLPDESVQQNQNLDEEPYGLEAMVHIAKWASKYIVMRLYQKVDAQELTYLLSIVETSASVSKEFIKEILRASFLKDSLFYAFSVCKKNSYGKIEDKLHKSLIPGSLLAQSASCVNKLIDHTLPQHVTIPYSTDSCSGDLEFIDSILKGLEIVVTEFTTFLASDGDKESIYKLFKLHYFSFAQILANVWKAVVLIRHSNTILPSSNNGYEQLRKFHSLLLNLNFDDIQNWKGMPLLDLRMLESVREGILALWSPREEVLQKLLEQESKTVSKESRMQESYILCCEWCLKSGDSVKLCQKCRKVSYCSADHQKLHWYKGHKAECRFLRESVENEQGLMGVFEGCSLKQEYVGNEEEINLFSFLSLRQRDEISSLGMRLPGIFILNIKDVEASFVSYASKSRAISFLEKNTSFHERSTHEKAVLLSLVNAKNQGGILSIVYNERRKLCPLSLTCIGSKGTLELAVNLE